MSVDRGSKCDHNAKRFVTMDAVCYRSQGCQVERVEICLICDQLVQVEEEP